MLPFFHVSRSELVQCVSTSKGACVVLTLYGGEVEDLFHWIIRKDVRYSVDLLFKYSTNPESLMRDV